MNTIEKTSPINTGKSLLTSVFALIEGIELVVTHGGSAWGFPVDGDAIAQHRHTVKAQAATQAQHDADAAAGYFCFKCSGTGLYDAPTTRTHRGMPVCFKCLGSGLSVKGRKAGVRNAGCF